MALSYARVGYLEEPYSLTLPFLPSLHLDFLTQYFSIGRQVYSFEDIFVLERASGGGRWNSEGAYEWLANDTPRFDHDPVTGDPVGLLVERESTNEFLDSEAPATQNITVTAEPYTLSFYGAGDIILSGAHTGGLVGEAVGERVVLTFTPSAGTLTLTVTGTEKVQLEKGAVATSYIPTTNTPVTRAADTLYLNDISWVNAARGTLMVEAVVPSSHSMSTGAILSLGDESAGDDYIALLAKAGGTLGGVVSVAGSLEAEIDSTGSAQGVPARAVITYAINDVRFTALGEPVQQDTSVSLPALERLYIGRTSDGGNSVSMGIRLINYYPTALSNTSLVSMSEAALLPPVVFEPVYEEAALLPPVMFEPNYEE